MEDHPNLFLNCKMVVLLPPFLQSAISARYIVSLSPSHDRISDEPDFLYGMLSYESSMWFKLMSEEETPNFFLSLCGVLSLIPRLFFRGRSPCMSSRKAAFQCFLSFFVAVEAPNFLPFPKRGGLFLFFLTCPQLSFSLVFLFTLELGIRVEVFSVRNRCLFISLLVFVFTSLPAGFSPFWLSFLLNGFLFFRSVEYGIPG